MPKRVSEHELAPVLRAVAQHPEGLGVSEIYARLNGGVPRRTLQRWLAALVDTGRLAATGSGPARRYREAGQTFYSAEPVDDADNAVWEEIVISLSAEAREIRDLVRRSVAMREPVSYRDSFLNDYKPNRSFYLPKPVRERMAEQGSVKDDVQPAGTFAKQLYQRLLIDLSWNSSRLEGNTYSMLETERLLQTGQAVAGRDTRETQMILNHKAAIELLVDSAEEIAFNSYTIRNLHALLSENLLPDPSSGGRLRNIPVGIGGSVYAPSDDPHRIATAFQTVLEKAEAINDPFEQAFFAMAHIAYLQPFEDVNKRVSRLAANIPLIQHNLCPLSFVDMPERDYISALLGVYELNRVEYLRDLFVWAYERSCGRYGVVRQTVGEPDPLRLAYRVQIAELIADMVRSGITKEAAPDRIRQFAAIQLPIHRRPRFMEIVENELLSLHEGNIARYKLTLAEFSAWRARW